MEKQLPKNWVETELGLVAEVTSGYGFPIKYQGFSEYEIPFFKVGDISENFKRGNVFLTTANNYINEEILKTIKAKKLTAENIVFAKIGEAIRLNRRAITTKDCVVDNNVMALKFYKNVLFKYGYYFFKTVTLIDLSAGNAVPSIRKSVIEELNFPLPPLAEQNRIVAKLDTLFTQLETIKGSMANIPLLLKDFRQQVLTQAVTGKLTSEWRKGKESESAEVLIQKIIQKRIQDFDLKCKLAKEKGERKPTKVLLDKLPKIERIDVDLPEKWFQTSVHFLSFVTKLAGFEYSLHFDLKEEGEIPVVRAQNVQMGRFEDKNRLYMSKETSDFLVRSQLHGREILMVFIGAGTGNVCLAPKDERWHLAPNVAKIDVDGISTEYLYLYLQSALGIENVLSRVKATAQPSLSMETIRDIVALVPPLEEQYEIVSRVENLFAQSEAIKKQYKLLKEKIDNLPQALLHKAFKGELTQQLDSDGDAKELLKAISDLKNIKVIKPKAYKVPKEKIRLVAEKSDIYNNN